jgi:glutamate/aspartate transport system substrate-binding protein
MNKFIFLSAMFLLSNAYAESTLKKIKDSGTINVGVRESSGLSYTIGNNQYVGYHVELCNKVLAGIQKQLGLKKLDIKYIPVTSQNRIPLMTNSTIDIECGSTTNNLARQKEVAFAVTTFVEEVRIAVKANSGINGIAQLAGKNVAVTTGTTSVQTLRKHEKGANINFNEIYGKDHSDSFLLLESGRADAFIMDGSILAANISKSKKPSDYKLVGEVLSVEPIGIMMRKDDPEFKKAVDDQLKAIMKSGEIAKIWDKWFMQPVPPTNIKIGLPPNENTKAAWANPNDKPMEEYAVKK